MPIYDYRCRDCGRRVTVLQRAYSDLPPPCPDCGADVARMTRLISRVSVVKSQQDRTTDLSWVDRDVARRLKSKSGTRPSPDVQETLDRMESS